MRMLQATETRGVLVRGLEEKDWCEIYGNRDALRFSRMGNTLPEYGIRVRKQIGIQIVRD